jgi:integrase
MIASQWSAIDWQQKTLLVIADVSKNKREHLIPLTESALQELASVKELTKESNSPYIFPLSTNGERPVRTDSLARSIMYFGLLILSLKFSRREIYAAPVKR